MTKIPKWKRFSRIIVFIDSTNVIYSLRSLGWKMSYKKLKRYFQRNANLADIYFFSAYAKESKTQKDLFEMLSRIGLIVRTKTLKYIKRGGKIILVKGNVDVELTIDVIALLENMTQPYYISGNSDFATLVNYVKGKKKKVIVVSTRGHISRELRDAADKFIYLDKFRRFWELRP